MKFERGEKNKIWRKNCTRNPVGYPAKSWPGCDVATAFHFNFCFHSSFFVSLKRSIAVLSFRVVWTLRVRLSSLGESWTGGPPNPLVRLRGRWAVTDGVRIALRGLCAK